MAAPTAVQISQQKFLMAGGTYELPLQQMRERGQIDTDYVFREYPKHIGLGARSIVVHSAEEEDRVLSGGMTSAQIEDERQDLMQRCRNLHITVDPNWTIVRLKRELGEKLDAPEPADEMGALKEKLAALEEMAAMKARIAALETQLSAKPEDADDLRAQLAAHGIKADGRWSAARLREELDRIGVQA